MLNFVIAGETTVPVTFASLMNPIDIDGGDVGVAIVGTKGTKGDWKYSTDGGGPWNLVDKVSAGKSLFLNPDAMIRFTAASDAKPGTAGVSFKAWDKTTGLAGTRGPAKAANTSKNTEVVTAAVGNTVPVLDTSAEVTLPAVKVTPKPGNGFAVSKLLTKGASDRFVDGREGCRDRRRGRSERHVAVFARRQRLGGLRSRERCAAVLLTTANKIRFVPNQGTPAGTQATIQFKAWDGSTGLAGDRIDTTSAALNSFSTAVETATIDVAV